MSSTKPRAPRGLGLHVYDNAPVKGWARLGPKETWAGNAQPADGPLRPMGMDLRKRLYRSRTDRMIAGVAGGMAEYLDIDPTLVRLLWALAFLPGGVPGLLLYVLCWIIIPMEPSTQHDETRAWL